MTAIKMLAISLLAVIFVVGACGCTTKEIVYNVTQVHNVTQPQVTTTPIPTKEVKNMASATPDPFAAQRNPDRVNLRNNAVTPSYVPTTPEPTAKPRVESTI